MGRTRVVEAAAGKVTKNRQAGNMAHRGQHGPYMGSKGGMPVAQQQGAGQGAGAGPVDGKAGPAPAPQAAGAGGKSAASAGAEGAKGIGLVSGTPAMQSVGQTQEAVAATAALAEATNAARQAASHVGYLVGMQEIVASKGDSDAARHFANRCL